MPAEENAAEQTSLHVALLEDDPAEAKQLKDALDVWAHQNNVSLFTTIFGLGEDLCDAWKNVAPFDVLFLDIQIPGHMSGMEVAEYVRKTSWETRIVFVTSSTEYLRHGYEVEATDYLVKPINEREFSTCMSRLVRQLSHHETIIVRLRSRDMINVPTNAIDYISSNRNYVDIHIGGSSPTIYRTKETLKGIRERLPRYFVQSRRTDIVNIFHVVGFTGTTLKLRGGLELDIGGRYLADVRRAYTHVFGEGW